eukprot:scaffold16801_cov73-Skeletonema_marinoi.AAC.1
MHEGIEKVGERAFYCCWRLKGIKLLGVREVEEAAFCRCEYLTDVKFGDKLETIGINAFSSCRFLKSIKLPSVRAIALGAFGGCKQLNDAEFSDRLEEVAGNAFNDCTNLRRITIPMKENLFPPDLVFHRCNQFDNCPNLTTIDLVGGTHNIISSLLLKTWRDDMNHEIDSINFFLPHFAGHEKIDAIQPWIRSVLCKIVHYKAEHSKLLKEATTLLELAIWKAKLDEKTDSSHEGKRKKAKIDVESMRTEKRITSGADIVIKNVLPFLELDE